jgi:hypothetical protein
VAETDGGSTTVIWLSEAPVTQEILMLSWAGRRPSGGSVRARAKIAPMSNMLTNLAVARS